MARRCLKWRKKKCKKPTASACPRHLSQKSNAHLLHLPAELRNKIYRFTLLDSDDEDRIKISNQNKPPKPSILSVNQQIRNEAWSIYHRENYFSFVVDDYDSTLIQKWIQTSKDHQNLNQDFIIGCSTNWSNLLAWIKAWYDGKTGGVYPSILLDCPSRITGHIFRIVDRLKEFERLSWEEIMEYLDEVHMVLITTNPAWT